jgi:glycosyltransferase involved in cell wall biosynthesis
MKKILFVANYHLNGGGISGQIELLLKYLTKEGYCVDLFNTKQSLIRRLLLYRKLCKVGREYDLFHIHACSNFGFFPAIIGILAAKKLKKRVVLTYHGGGADAFFQRHIHLVSKYLNMTDVNIVLSGYLASIFDKYNIPYTIIPNIIELDGTLFKRRNSLHPHYISVRTLSSDYNVQCIIQAFDIVKKKIPDATLSILGDGPLKNSLMNLVSRLNLADVSFVGRVPNSQIYTYLDRADIFITSPIIDNQPMSVLEAFNAGLLVISSNVGGIPYMIEDGKTGLLFKSNDYVELARLMEIAVQSQSKSIDVINAAKESLSKYQWDSVRCSLMNVYKDS